MRVLGAVRNAVRSSIENYVNKSCTAACHDNSTLLSYLTKQNCG
jgi:hypothetical protein